MRPGIANVRATPAGVIASHSVPTTFSFSHVDRLRAVPLRSRCVRTNVAAKRDVLLTPLHEEFGAEVVGLDLRGGISEEDGVFVKEALDKYKLLRFRGQRLEPEDEVKFLSCLPHDEQALKEGRSKNPNQPHIPSQPWIAVRAFNLDLEDHYGLKIEPQSSPNIFSKRRVWHMDLDSCECPPEYSYMHMKITPSVGGQTLFASTIKAYEMLSDEKKAVVDKLRRVSFSPETAIRIVIAPNNELLPSESGIGLDDVEAIKENFVKLGFGDSMEEEESYPFVVQDEESGERSVIVTGARLHHFEGMTSAASHALLEEIFAPVITPENILAVDWKPDDVVVWKNRQLIHSGSPSNVYTGQPRLFHLVFHESVRPAKGPSNA